MPSFLDAVDQCYSARMAGKAQGLTGQPAAAPLDATPACIRAWREGQREGLCQSAAERARH